MNRFEAYEIGLLLTRRMIAQTVIAFIVKITHFWAKNGMPQRPSAYDNQKRYFQQVVDILLSLPKEQYSCCHNLKAVLRNLNVTFHRFKGHIVRNNIYE